MSWNYVLKISFVVLALCLTVCEDSHHLVYPVPQDLIMPSVLPKLPEWVRKQFNIEQGFSPFGKGNCKTSLLLTKEKVLRVAKNIRVSCLRNGKSVDGLSVKWERPTGGSEITGYQIYHVISGKPGVAVGARYCNEVRKDKEHFVISKQNGFRMAKEISLTVVALPLPFKADINLQKFQICNETSGKRQRRSLPDQQQDNITTTQVASTTGNEVDLSAIVQTNAVTTSKRPPKIIILGPGDPVPTGLIMPSKIPTFSPDPNSNCHHGSPYNNITKFPGQPEISSVECMKEGLNNNKTILVTWKPPSGYRTKEMMGFNVYYSTMEPRNYDRDKLFCEGVVKTSYSVLLQKGIDKAVASNYSIWIGVVTMPVPDGYKIQMKAFTPCKEHSPTIPPAMPGGDNEGKDKVKGIIGGTTTAVALLALLAAFHWWYKSRKKQIPPFPQPTEKDYIYISYYPETDKATASVLNLVARLRGHGLNVIMDALCQREIDQVGMPRWYHSQLEAAKKIILVISKSYLKVCQEWRRGFTSDDCNSNTHDSNENKIFFELEYISTDIFTRRSPEKLLIVLADVKETELPALLKGKSTYPWPKGTDEETKLVRAISGKEEFVTA